MSYITRINCWKLAWIKSWVWIFHVRYTVSDICFTKASFRYETIVTNTRIIRFCFLNGWDNLAHINVFEITLLWFRKEKRFYHNVVCSAETKVVCINHVPMKNPWFLHIFCHIDAHRNYTGLNIVIACKICQ
jgi:hypothetical protein